GTKSHLPEAKSHLPEAKSHLPEAKSHLPGTKSHLPGTKRHLPETKSHFICANPHHLRHLRAFETPPWSIACPSSRAGTSFILHRGKDDFVHADVVWFGRDGV
ncbi:MAG: hypothetical protein LBF89_11325, partial [Bacteroidales bacterium]|nr:hypothetical protein [Bacteroidales bacterium]